MNEAGRYSPASPNILLFLRVYIEMSSNQKDLSNAEELAKKVLDSTSLVPPNQDDVALALCVLRDNKISLYDANKMYANVLSENNIFKLE